MTSDCGRAPGVPPTVAAATNRSDQRRESQTAATRTSRHRHRAKSQKSALESPCVCLLASSHLFGARIRRSRCPPCRPVNPLVRKSSCKLGSPSSALCRGAGALRYSNRSVAASSTSNRRGPLSAKRPMQTVIGKPDSPLSRWRWHCPAFGHVALGIGAFQVHTKAPKPGDMLEHLLCAVVQWPVVVLEVAQRQ